MIKFTSGLTNLGFKRTFNAFHGSQFKIDRFGSKSIESFQSRQSKQLVLKSFLATQSGNENKPPSNLGRIAGIGGAIAVLAGKGKYLLVAAKLTKFSSVFSMLATTGTYALFFGWPFAVGMVGQIMLHESGHALAMHALNIPFGPAVFIPFMGAVVPMQGRPKDVREEALVAIAGPIFGGVTAVGISAAGILSGNQLLITLADFGLMINLFNMMPIGDLDGGRISKAISKYLLLVGMGGGIFMAYEGIIRNPIFYLVLLSGAFTTYGRFFGSSMEPHPSYYRINGGERIMWGGAYFGLILALFIAMQINRSYMKSVRQLRNESGSSEIGEYEAQLHQFAHTFGHDDPFLTPSLSNGTASQFEKDQDFFKSYFGDEKSI